MNDTRIARILQEIKSLLIILIIALSLRATVIEAYIVPTGSMENTIMTGDFLIGNKFVYGMRTPDWIGIPYTELGFYVPWTRFPKFKKPHRGDVVIFKYPRDHFQKYVKRCVAEPGQTITVRGKKVWVDNQEFELPEHGKLIDRTILKNGLKQPGIFLRDDWNRDNFGPIKLPAVGDEVAINRDTNWDYLLPLILMDGHEVTLKGNGISGEFSFTMKDANDIARRYSSGLGGWLHGIFSSEPYRPNKVGRLYSKYYNQNNPDGELLNIWSFRFTDEVLSYLWIDGNPMNSIPSYVVEQNYYWMMGDNRDDSADSRYWGFVPEEFILGEAVVVYMSWGFNGEGPRFNRVGKIIS